MESFILVSQSAQLLHYAALLLKYILAAVIVLVENPYLDR